MEPELVVPIKSGFLLDVSSVNESSESLDEVYYSKDGSSWRRDLPDSLYGNVYGETRLVSDSSRAFLLGIERTSRKVAVWTYGDMGWGSPAILPAGDPYTFNTDSWGMAAGPAGVVVVRADRDDKELYDFWTSNDGVAFLHEDAKLSLTFSKPSRVVEYEDSFYDIQGITPLNDGFLLVLRQGFFVMNEDASVSKQIATNLREDYVIDAIAQNGGRLVVAAREIRGETIDGIFEGESRTRVWWADAKELPSGLTFQMAKVDPGKLPDIGVGVVDHAVIQRVVPFSKGFFLLGSASDVGASWTSSDGKEWKKQGVRLNSFEEAKILVDLASNSSGSVLIGVGVTEEGYYSMPHVWRSKAD